MKTENIIIIIFISVVAIYAVWMDIINSQQMKRNSELVSDVRQLLFASLEDVDTLFLSDRIMIFNRGYSARKKFEKAMQEGEGMNIIWNTEKTLDEIDIYDERNQIPKFNIDTGTVDGESTDSLTILKEKTK